MRVSRDAKRNYLQRNLCNSNKAKQLTENQANKLLAKLSPVPKFVTEPRLHQKICFLLGVKYPQYTFHCDMGTGKTKISLDLISYRRQTGELKKPALVLVPGVSNMSGWVDEVEVHAPHLRIKKLSQNGREARLAAVLSDDYDILVATYVGYAALVSRKVKGRKKSSLYIDDADPDSLAIFDKFGFVVYDECTSVQNTQSLSYAACKPFLETAKFRIGLTGTPFGRCPMALFGQFMLVDSGETFGTSLPMFKHVFFSETFNHFGRREYKFSVRMKPVLTRMLKHRAIRWATDECQDLPEKVYKVVTVPASNGVAKSLTQLRKESIDVATTGSLAEIKNVFTRMRMLASGFTKVIDQVTGDEHYVDFNDSPKLDAVIEMVESLPDEEQVLVFCYFKHSVQRVVEALRSRKIKCATIYSGSSNKEKESAVRDYRSGAVRVIVATEAAAYGLNLQAGRYELFYESPVRPILRQQMEKRAHREGQKRTVFIYDFVTVNTVEQRILKFLAEGKDLFEAVVEGKATL